MTLPQDKPPMDYKIFPTVDKIAQRSVLRASPNMTVHEVSQLMEQHNVSSVVIEDADGMRILSIEDLLKHLNQGGSGSATLNQLPKHILTTIQSNQHILRALELLAASGDRYLAVEHQDGGLLGILTYTDLLSAADPTLLIETKTIGELISRSVPVTFSMDWFLEDVLCHFKKLEDSIIVVDDGIPLGIITTKDVFKILASGTPTNRPVTEFMTAPVVTILHTKTVSDAFDQLKSHHIKRLVVINEQNKLAGVITQSELVGFAYGSWITLSQQHSSELRELVSMLDKKTAGIDSSGMLDPVTGLGNRQMLLIHITQEIERSRRYRCPTFCLLLLTIDPPSDLNDDEQQQTIIIKTVSSELTNVIRAMDSLCLWNDNTFAVLLPHTNSEQAECLISRMRENILDLALLQKNGYTITMNCHSYFADESASAFMDRIAQNLPPASKTKAKTALI